LSFKKNILNNHLIKINNMSATTENKNLGIFRVNGVVYGMVSKDYIHDNEMYGDNILKDYIHDNEMTDTKINLINLEVI